MADRMLSAIAHGACGRNWLIAAPTTAPTTLPVMRARPSSRVVAGDRSATMTAPTNA